VSRYRQKYMDPEGRRYGIPSYPWRWAPEGLATRRQLRSMGLRPAGQQPCGQVLRPSRDKNAPKAAYLYRIDLAAPVREMTPGRWRTHTAMMRVRRTCRTCKEVFPFDLSRKHDRTCWPCLEAEGVTL